MEDRKVPPDKKTSWGKRERYSFGYAVFLIGASRRGNKPPVLPGERKNFKAIPYKYPTSQYTIGAQ